MCVFLRAWAWASPLCGSRNPESCGSEEDVAILPSGGQPRNYSPKPQWAAQGAQPQSMLDTTALTGTEFSSVKGQPRPAYFHSLHLSISGVREGGAGASGEVLRGGRAVCPPRPCLCTALCTHIMRTHTQTHEHMHTLMRTHPTHVHAHTPMFTHIHTHVHTQTLTQCTHAYTHMCVHAHTHTGPHTHTHAVDTHSHMCLHLTWGAAGASV